MKTFFYRIKKQLILGFSRRSGRNFFGRKTVFTQGGQRRATAKAFAKDVPFDQERKSGDRRRSDTVVVPTVNDADLGIGGSNSKPIRRIASRIFYKGRPRRPLPFYFDFFGKPRVFGFRGEYGRKAET